MTPVAARHFGLMCRMSEIRVDEKGLCQLDGLDMPWHVGSRIQPGYSVAGGACAALEQVFGNVERLYPCLCSRAIPIGTRQCLSGAPQSLFNRVRVAAKQPGAVVLDKRLQHRFGIAVGHST